MLIGKQYMKTLVSKKSIDYIGLENYLLHAHKHNKFANGGHATRLLEERAREMLKIDDSKAVVAACSGTAALHSIIFALQRTTEKNLRIVTQDFNFPSASQGPATGPIIVDFDENLNFALTDDLANEYGKLLIVTNCFGHLQDLDRILHFAQKYDKLVVFDNAATPYSFYKGVNSCNLGTASFISLHHTKPIGFGEGGLAIVDKHLEEQVRIACNFGFVDRKFNERGSNFKISEISAASILQYWDTFNIDSLKDKILDSYFDELFKLNSLEAGDTLPNHADNNSFLPMCLPYLHLENKLPENDEQKKYYTPLRGLPISKQVYDRIICYPLMEDLSD